jgi:tetratricopeptide (TPR) repeat protein
MPLKLIFTILLLFAMKLVANNKENNIAIFNSLINSGDAAFKNGKYVQAEMYYTQAINITKDDIRNHIIAYKHKIKLLIEIDLHKKAQEEIEVALKIDKNNKQIIKMYFTTLIELNNTKKAIDTILFYFSLGLSKEEKIFALSRLARLYIKIENYKNALECAQELKVLEGDKNIESKTLIAKIYFLNKKYQESLILYKELTQQEKSSSVLYYNAAISAYSLKDYDTSISLLDEAISIAPNLEYYSQRGYGYIKKKEYGKARENYKYIISINKNDAIALEKLSYIEYKTGNKNEAMKYAKKACLLGKCNIYNKLIENNLK